MNANCTEDMNLVVGRHCAYLEQEATRLEELAKAFASGVHEGAEGLSDQDRADVVEALYQEVGRKMAASIINMSEKGREHRRATGLWLAG
ncbi:hypothetical protein [Streptomyces sp. NPDC093589]|uniref:hypothetical protein n=1 Tax=Streptomyces sp. NPDC093589 TaxID=3366043 RepID=UPI00380043C3